MEQNNHTADQIDDYFRDMDEATSSELASFSQIFTELALVQKTVSHKEIIAGLIQKLDTEPDEAKVKIYRRMLEIMIRSTR